MKILSIIFIAFFIFSSPLVTEGQYFDRIQPNGEKVSPRDVLQARTPGVIVEDGEQKHLIVALNDSIFVVANKATSQIKIAYAPPVENVFYLTGDSTGYSSLAGSWLRGLSERNLEILLQSEYRQEMSWVIDFLRIHIDFIQDSCPNTIESQVLAKWYYAANPYHYIQFRYNFETYTVLKGPGEVSFILYKWKDIHQEYQIIPFTVRDNIIFCQHDPPSFLENHWALGLEDWTYEQQETMLLFPFILLLK